jgi:hypothetical protein
MSTAAPATTTRVTVIPLSPAAPIRSSETIGVASRRRTVTVASPAMRGESSASVTAKA